MKKFLMIIATIAIIAITVSPVSAMELTAPEAPVSVERYVPQQTESFWDGLWYIIKNAVGSLQPSIRDSIGICISVLATSVLLSMLQGLTGGAKRITELAGTIALSIILLQPTNTMIRSGTSVVEEMSEYGKLLLPVMTTALAAQGAASTSAALYTGSTIFINLLTAIISKLIVPMIYIFICLCIADHALNSQMLKNLKKFAKWLMTWSLKIVIYVFTGYVSITGIVSGTADASAVKAAKLAISGVVPVVGSIISDASETVLVGAGVMKNSVGIYGLFVIIAMCIGPFLQIGIQYLLLKITVAISSVFGSKSSLGTMTDISGAMGFVLAMIGTVSLLLMISVVCFMKGIS